MVLLVVESIVVLVEVWLVFVVVLAVVELDVALVLLSDEVELRVLFAV